jgi:hypothetical protein
MKKIIAASSLVLLLTLFYYPILDDEKISFAVIFLCFVVLIFSVAKLYSPDEKEDYNSVEKEMDRLHKYDGIFRYTNDGVYFKQNKETEFIKWDEIVSVYTFTIPSPFDKKQSGLEIITNEKSYEFDDKVTPGIIKLKDHLSSNLPVWELDSPTVRMNNFGLEKTKLYEKKNI